VIPSSNLVGAIEAKTKFGELLERVQLGDSFTITKHGRPIARLVGYDCAMEERRQAATAALRNLRSRYQLHGVNPRVLREEGRPAVELNTLRTI
jgi:prevent-host-death family protein